LLTLVNLEKLSLKLQLTLKGSKFALNHQNRKTAK